MLIPAPYRDEDQDYITVPALKTLCNKYNLSTEGNRIDIILRIEEYSKHHNEFEDELQRDIDNILKEGIKTCVLSKIMIPEVLDAKFWTNKLIRTFGGLGTNHLCNVVPQKEITLVNYTFVTNEKEDIVSIEFVFHIELLRSKGTYYTSGIQVFYPIHVCVDFEKGFIVGRAKTTSLLFRVDDGLQINPSRKTSTEAIIKETLSIVLDKLNIEKEDGTIQKNAFKRTIFNILDTYTKTPPEIKKKMREVQVECNEFVDTVFKKLGISETITIMSEAKYDLQIFVEKYISVTYKDKSVFIEDREAYPVRFLSKDNELTTIQESSAGIEDPLQSKRAFFDSKKVVYTDKKCDKLSLCHKSKRELYYGEKPFVASIYLSGCDCAVKFNRFVKEGDIENVLSRIIQLYNVQK